MADQAFDSIFDLPTVEVINLVKQHSAPRILSLQALVFCD